VSTVKLFNPVTQQHFTKAGQGGSVNANFEIVKDLATQEGTVGLTQTLWRDGRYGAMQLMWQYAYFFRNPWFVPSGAPKNTHQNAVWFNLRYVLPGSAPTLGK